VSQSPKREKLYQRAGIEDLAEFYRARYASNQLLDARYFDPLNRFDICWSRTMWVYDNVRRNSLVLDVGCGAGVLALLKRKDVTLVGADISSDCAAVAERNGYDAAYAAALTALPFPDATYSVTSSLPRKTRRWPRSEGC
jgi:2-polyprenyl-3-methyl-5-hydroxy-6-metoxy-1,4-benzoquinol methylase